MTRSATAWPGVDGDFDGGRTPGVFVVDAHNTRRQATLRLLGARSDLRVVGDHPGSPGAVDMVVRALPHLCVVGSTVLPGRTAELIADIERALPATRCVRVPKIVGANRAMLSPAQRVTQQRGMDAFLDLVLQLVGLPTSSMA